MSPISIPGKVKLKKQPSPWAEGGDTVYELEISGTVYRVHIFTTVGTSELMVLNGGSFEYLVVAGGGGGGSRTYGGNIGAGGGGAGGYRCSVSGELSGGNTPAESPFTASVGTYSVIVGNGGAGATAAADDNFSEELGEQGESSSIFGITAFGGGGAERFASNVGSGGGRNAYGALASRSGTPGQGSSGGSTSAAGLIGGGGGGAGAAGNAGSATGNGNGGIGIASAITGVSVTRAGGGGAGAGGIGGSGGGGNGGASYWSVGSNGAANTGGGGGGAASTLGVRRVGGNGGSGIVIVRYAL
jgi:hypothetical protein